MCFIPIYWVLNILSEYMYILLHIKKHYFIHFCCLFLKLSKAFSVSLSVKKSFWKYNFWMHQDRNERDVLVFSLKNSYSGSTFFVLHLHPKCLSKWFFYNELLTVIQTEINWSSFIYQSSPFDACNCTRTCQHMHHLFDAIEQWSVV